MLHIDTGVRDEVWAVFFCGFQLADCAAALQILKALPIDVLLLRWLNYQLHRSVVGARAGRGLG